MNKIFTLLFLSIIFLSQAGFVLAVAAGDCVAYCNSLANSDPADDLDPPTIGEVCFCNPLGTTDIGELIENITNYIFYVAIVLAPLMILIGAFMYLTSAGDPNRVKRATDLIKWTIIGFAIILFSRGIYSLIKSVLGA